MSSHRITVVGLGADGWAGLPPASRAAIDGAEVLLGGSRHLGLVPASDAVKEAWPSPLMEGLPGLLERYAGRRVVALASGDPLLSGIGATLVSLLGADRVEVLPAVSSVTLARARMRWPADTVDVITLVGRDADALHRHLTPGRRLVLLSGDGGTPAQVAERLVTAGFEASRLTVLADLGADTETRVERTARDWQGAPAPRLNVVCVEVVPDPATAVHPAVPGLPDTAFEHDGQLTKRDLRTSALSRLAPAPGELLWDVGAGAGSVAIEWLRTDPRCRAVAVEASAGRAASIRRNAARLGVPTLVVHQGRAPAALADLPAPDAVFVGGAGSVPGVLDRCWEALAPGGRLVAHAVTLETEAVVVAGHRRLGGELTRLSVERAEPLGGFTGWSPARPVVQWSVQKERTA